MYAINHIAFIRDADCRMPELAEKIASEGYTVVPMEPTEDFFSILMPLHPSLLILSGELAPALITSILKSFRERFSHVPVILAFKEYGTRRKETIAPTTDGICYADMPQQELALLLRGIIRAGFTVRELLDANRKLNEKSITDALTGIYNRGYLMDRLSLEFKRAGRNREAISCVMIDIDHFKQINDTYGHKFGDVVLQSVAQRLSKLVRETDIFGRYGGEEFLLILPNTTLEGAVKLAEKLQGGMEAQKFTHEFFALVVTASFGVASNENVQIITPDHLLQFSDRALYQAKESGRNRVCVANEQELDLVVQAAPIANTSSIPQRAHIDIVSASAHPEENPLLAALMQSNIHETVVHRNDLKFLDSFRNHQPDLLIIDGSNAEGKKATGDSTTQDPYDLCCRIKKQGHESFLPVVFLLAEPDESLRKRALESGADDVLMHRMEAREFLTRLQAMLHLKMLHDRWRDTYHDLTMTRARLIKAERLTALGEMAGGVAHDFNNILSAILGRAQIMRRQIHDADLLRNLDIIEKAANDGAATIRRIQNFSRSTSDKVYEHIDMAQVVHDCIQMTRTRWKDQAEYQSITYTFNVDMPDEMPVRGNAAELREVITNLIMNALDAMPTGGDISFSGEISHDQVLLNIADTGCGMEEDVLRRIFDPFFSTKKGDGTGLGLSVAYGIILRHHGKIECSSVKSSGTVFRIQLPYEIAEPEVQTHLAAPLTLEPSTEHLRILVVDDEPTIREIFRDALEPEGHDVLLAESGPMALKILETEKIDLLFTDLGMPEMSGWEVARRVRKNDPDVFIVLTSGWGQEFNQKQISKHGINYVLPKPVQFGALLSLVQKVAMGFPVENAFTTDAH